MPVEAFPTIAAEELRKRSVSNLLRMGHAYIERDGTTECARIARLVSERVAEMIAAA